MEKVIFTKMHGLGNDYIYIDCLDGEWPDPGGLAVEMSNRHTGVGADGIILICRSEIADFKMRMFNADGSEGKMCGNASRCIGKYVYERGLTDKTDLTLETLSGIKSLQLHVNSRGVVDSVTVDMGAPELVCEKVPVVFKENVMIDEPVATSMGDLHVTAISMGNPHGVVFVDADVAEMNIEGIGRELETHPMWPDRANIEFARVIDRATVEMRVWERGSGETMACGTGACATAVAASLLGYTDKEVTIKLRGGDLKIEIGTDGHVLMTGPAETVFDGCYYRNKN